MDNAVLPAEHQGAGDIPPEANNGLFRDILRQGFQQRGQQLHADEDIPAYAVVMLDVAYILAVYHIGAAVQLPHEGIFRYNAPEVGLEGCGNAFVIIALAPQLLHVAGILGQGDDLHGRRLHSPVHQPAPNLINRPKASPADHADSFPLRPWGFA